MFTGQLCRALGRYYGPVDVHDAQRDCIVFMCAALALNLSATRRCGRSAQAVHPATRLKKMHLCLPAKTGDAYAES